MFHPDTITGNGPAPRTLSNQKQFDFTEAKQIGDALKIPWDMFDVEQFRMGLNMELEHGRREAASGTTRDESIATGKIVLAHLNAIPDYYTQLAVMIGSSLSTFHSFRFLLV